MRRGSSAGSAHPGPTIASDRYRARWVRRCSRPPAPPESPASEIRGVRFEPPEPVELVVEFRSRLRIAVRQIDTGDDDAVDGGFDIARLALVAVARPLGADQHRIGAARQDGDAVPGLLSAPDRAVAGLGDG